jgi:hypothetical protein
VFEFQARLSAAVAEVGRLASEQPASAEAKATLAQLQGALVVVVELDAEVVVLGRSAQSPLTSLLFGSLDAAACRCPVLTAFTSGLTQLISLFFGWGGAAGAGAGAGAGATPTRSASPALRMVANMNLAAASTEEAATALLVRWRRRCEHV